jgi:hypothetical protein
MFPIIGLFVFLIPAAGLVIGMGPLLIRRTRFLAPFAFLVPLLGGVGAVTGLFALGIAAERMGVPWWLVALATWGGLFGGGAVGGILGIGFGIGVLWMVRRVTGQLRKLNGSWV